jgi:hypothetical protein
MRIYDHSDALMYEEMLIESANEDDEENRNQYEFPEVERAPRVHPNTRREVGTRRLPLAVRPQQSALPVLDLIV